MWSYPYPIMRKWVWLWVWHVISPGVPWGPGCPEQPRALSPCLLCPVLSLVSLRSLWPVIGCWPDAPGSPWSRSGHLPVFRPWLWEPEPVTSPRPCTQDWTSPGHPWTGLDIPRYVNISPLSRDCHQHQKCLRIHQVLLSSVDILHCLLNCLKCPTRVLKTSPCLCHARGLWAHKKLGSQIVKVIKFCVRKEDNGGVIQCHSHSQTLMEHLPTIIGHEKHLHDR